MKKLIVILILIVPVLAGTAQDKEKKSKKELKAEAEARARKNVARMIDNRDFVFNATDMLPRGGGTMALGYDFDVQVRKDTLICYLPFIGKSYNTPYGATNSGFDFTSPVKDYSMKEKKKGYRVEVDVNDGTDRINFTFHITDLGASTLTVASSKRQSISYYGTIDPIK